MAGSDKPPMPLREGKRVGRFLVLRDLDGHLHAVSAEAVSAICETDLGSLLLLPGGRLIQIEQSMAKLLAWLDGR
jgi:hypothetical protein